MTTNIIKTILEANGKLKLGLFCVVVASMLVARAAPAGQLDDDEKVIVRDSLADFNRLHEGRPLGVPHSYDWYSRPVMKQGNVAGPNKALTGWGHVFWAEDSSMNGPDLQLRNLRVYLCSGSPGRWKLIQRGEIYGRQFDADFKQNTSQASKFQENNGELTVTLSRGSAFHFWPKMGRAILPNELLCGVVVTVQARVIRTPGTGDAVSGNYLVGLGADYWRDSHTAWNGKDSNPGIALGRLKYVTDAWRWYALNTADMDDTLRLLSDDFEVAVSDRSGENPFSQ
jgi:hypothetical protein